MKLGTSNCVNCSMSNPKHSAKYAYHIGTLASSTARARASCEMGMKTTKELSSTPWISSRFPITTHKGEPTGTVTGKSQEIAHTTSRTRSRRGVYTTGSFAMRRSARICMTQDAMKKCYVRWINWRTRITRTTLPQKKLKHTQTFGGCVRTHWLRYDARKAST